MLVLVTLTAACGFLSSFLLLRAGLHSMAVRYPVAVGLAYVVFLGLVALWLRRYRLHARVRSEGKGAQVDLDVLDVPFDQLWTGGPAPEAEVGFGGGGGFSGGGAGSSWGGGEGPTTFSSVAHVNLSDGASLEGHGDFGGLDLDEGAIWLVPVAIVGAIVLGGVIYVIYLAPVLLAELLLDAGLAAGLYKRLMREERRSWLATAVRSTIIPVCFVAGLLALAGIIMQTVYPDATSIGIVAKHLQERPAASSP
jgi:hypothetical protein